MNTTSKKLKVEQNVISDMIDKCSVEKTIAFFEVSKTYPKLAKKFLIHLKNMIQICITSLRNLPNWIGGFSGLGNQNLNKNLIFTSKTPSLLRAPFLNGRL